MKMGVFIIAEIGINHNGSIEIAKELINIAKECGCDAVKFQKRSIDLVYSQEFLNSPRESPWGKTQKAQKNGLELGKTEYELIDAYCKGKNIQWFASVWDIESQDFLGQYDCPYNKIASPMLTHIPLLEKVAEEGKQTFISTGMSNFEQIDNAIEIFSRANCPFTLMHCVSTYPCPDEDCNIDMVRVLKDKYNCKVGYSGHEVGLLPSVLAVALGAEAIERHITLDRAMYGSDQAASLERRGLQLLVRDCRLVETVIGDSIKAISTTEKEAEKKLRYFHEP